MGTTSKRQNYAKRELLVTNTQGYPLDTPHQPGGVFSGFLREFYPRYGKYSRDPMGRWYYHQFYGKERDLRIYTMYELMQIPIPWQEIQHRGHSRNCIWIEIEICETPGKQ